MDDLIVQEVGTLAVILIVGPYVIGVPFFGSPSHWLAWTIARRCLARLR